jgi:hypothetical protein
MVTFPERRRRINRFDALFVSSCAGPNGRAWLRYPNTLPAATELRGALGAAGGDSLRAMVLGFSLDYMTSTVRRNLLLYRTLVEEFEIPSCYPATGLPETPGVSPTGPARLRRHQSVSRPSGLIWPGRGA